MHDSPFTLYSRRMPAVWLLLVCSGFVAVGDVVSVSGEWLGILAAAFFGLGIPDWRSKPQPMNFARP